MEKDSGMFFGGIEGGGTKFVCGVGDGKGNLLDRVTIPTGLPLETVEKIGDYFSMIEQKYPLSRVGLGSFGPVDLNPNSKTFGYITSTPKKNWGFFDLKGAIERKLNKKVSFDTDVNAAAMGEYKWGAGQGHLNLVYLTIGTGIGGGVMINGQLVHGLVHPEIGHILIADDCVPHDYVGVCPYHKKCLEGLATGPAIEAMWKQKAEDLPSGHPAWDIEARVLANALMDLILTLSPTRIIMGGGVMEKKFLFPMIGKHVQTFLNNYVQHEEILNRIDTYIVPAGLGKNAGLLGAVALAVAE